MTVRADTRADQVTADLINQHLTVTTPTGAQVSGILLGYLIECGPKTTDTDGTVLTTFTRVRLTLTDTGAVEVDAASDINVDTDGS